MGGFGDTPISELAAEANVTSGLLYYYFGSKMGLFEAVASDARHRLDERLIGPILRLVAPQESLEARLVTLINVLAHRGSEDIGLHRMLLASDLEAERVPEVRAFRDSTQQDLVRLYAAIAGVDLAHSRDEQDSELMAFVELLMLGIWLFALRPHGAERLPIVVQAFIALLDGSLFSNGSVAAANDGDPEGVRQGPDEHGGVDAGLRDRIAKTALHQFAQGGYGKTSMKEIARQAGVTTGAIYYHFGSKAGLYRAAGEMGTRRLAKTYSATVAELSAERNQRQRVWTFFGSMVASVHELLDNHWIGVGVHVDAERFPVLADARDEWARDLERLYRVVAEGSAVGPATKEWEQSALPVLINVLTLGVSWLVVRDGPDALGPAIAGLQGFIAGDAINRRKAARGVAKTSGVVASAPPSSPGS